MRVQEVSVLRQVDGLVSAPTRGNVRGRISDSARIMEWEYSQDGMYLPGTSVSCRREYPGESSDDNRSYRGQRTPERGRYLSQNGRLPDRRRYPDRNRRPPRRGGYPGRGPPDGNRGPLDSPVDKGHQVLKDLQDQ